MSEWSRRAFLAGGVGGLAAAAGCSALPIGGSDEPSVDYDGERLLGAADPDAGPVPAAYPGVVPDGLADAHYERARALLDAVPEQPSFPNEAVTERLRDDRENTVQQLSEPPAGVETLDALAGWRFDRRDAAKLRGAYAAASDDVSAGDLAARRDAVRRDLAAFRGEWTYRAASPVAAFVVHRHLESLVEQCRERLVGPGSFPSDPESAVFRVGELVGDVELARALLDDAEGLRDAHVDDGARAHWTGVSTAAARLRRVVGSTRRRVEPYLGRDVGPESFERDVSGTPAERLFREARSQARSAPDRADTARERGDVATAVEESSHALVGLLAVSTAVDAIRDGQYGLPESTDRVLSHRETAVTAVEDALAVEPAGVAAVVAEPAWRALRNGDRELGQRREYEDGPPGRSDVVRAVGRYALAEHAADAVPAVVDRVASALDGGE